VLLADLVEADHGKGGVYRGSGAGARLPRGRGES
jgi:hypothetical protein